MSDESPGPGGGLPSGVSSPDIDIAAETASLREQTGAAAARGARWGLWLHVVGLPMSFVTNVILGRSSPEALGMYSATQVFIGVFQTFLVVGGSGVLARMVPAMRRERRLPFLLSYCGLVVAVLAVVCGAAVVSAPGPVRALLGRFGSPPPALAFVTGVAVIVWSFGTHFLFAVERAPRAAVLGKALVIGYFVVALMCLTPPGRQLLREPASPIWTATVIICLGAATLTVLAIGRLPEVREARPPFWNIPAGFWGTASYIQVGRLAEFAYSSLVPYLVLWFLDVESMGRLSASLRWTALLIVLPATFGWVLTPGFSKLEAAGQRDGALSLAASTMRICDLVIVPSALTLILFAPDFVGVFGRDYRAFAGLLSVIGLTVLSVPLVQIGTGLIVAFGELRVYVVSSIVNVVASLALGLALVPTWGLDGAAWALASSTAFQTCVIAWVLRRRIGFRIPSEAWTGWAFGLAALAATRFLGPSRLLALVAWVSLCAGFAGISRVTPTEVRRLVRRLF